MGRRRKYILEVSSRWFNGEEGLDPQFVPDGAKQEYVTVRRFGEIIREELRWVIELNSLEELERLAKWGQLHYGSLGKHNGELVIIYDSEMEYPIIEFYNDYRE